MNVILILLALLLTSCGNEQSDTGTNERQETGLQQPILGDEPRVVPPSNPQNDPQTVTCNETRIGARDIALNCRANAPTPGALEVDV